MLALKRLKYYVESTEWKETFQFSWMKVVAEEAVLVVYVLYTEETELKQDILMSINLMAPLEKRTFSV